MKKNKTKIHEIDSTNDIRYRGPLTYQHFRIIGWLFIALAQLAFLLSVGMKILPSKFARFETVQIVLSIIGQTAMPMLLIANFAVILSGRESFKKLLMRFGGLSLAAAAGFYILFERYAVGIVALAGSRDEARVEMLNAFSEGGFVAFNLFLDLFLCTLVMFFLDYVPKKRFQGRAHIIFRMFALIPILYEAVSVLLKILTTLGYIRLSPYLYPFLTTKPPLGFALFVTLALFIKRRERKFIKNGKTLEDYNAYLQTNSNSWHFSVHAAVIMVIAAVVDILIVIIVCLVAAGPYEGTELYDMLLTEKIGQMMLCGFGESVLLIFVAPLMLLFSYNRAPKKPELDKYIPIGGIALVIIVYIEGIYQGMRLIA